MMTAAEEAKREQFVCAPLEFQLNTPGGSKQFAGWLSDLGHIREGHFMLRFRPLDGAAPNGDSPKSQTADGQSRNGNGGPADAGNGQVGPEAEPFHQVAERVPLGVALVSDAGFIVYRNAEFGRFFAHSNTLNLRDLADGVVEKDHDSIAAWIESALAGETVDVSVAIPSPGLLTRVRLEASTSMSESAGQLIVLTIHDITQMVAAQESLRQVIDLVPYLVFAVDLDGVLRFANEATSAFLGTSAAHMEGQELRDVLGPSMSDDFLRTAHDLTERGVPLTDLEDIAVDSDGKERFLNISLIPFEDAVSGTPTLLAVCNDVTRQVNNEGLLSALGRSMPDLAIIDRRDERAFVSASVQDLLGWLPEEFLNLDPTDAIHPDDITRSQKLRLSSLSSPGTSHKEELRLLHHDGTWRWFEVNAANLSNVPAIQGMLSFGRDIGDRKEKDLQLRHEATHDQLTGLLNRSAIIEELQMGLGEARVSQTPIGTLFIDIDNFKMVNDALGHEAGDRLLSMVASTISEATRGRDTVGRLGGDEFLVVVRDVEDEQTLTEVANRIISAAAVLTRDTSFPVTLSVGACLSTTGKTTAGALVRDADAAMYRAKMEGKNRTQLFHSDMNDHAVRRLEVSRQLSHALETETFAAHFQPVFQLKDGIWSLRALEALARCQLPDDSFITPDEFIPVAEQTGLITGMGRRVTRLALEELAKWRSAGKVVQVWINLSLSELTQPNLSTWLLKSIDEAGLPPNAVGIEITESMLSEIPGQLMDTLAALREAGVTVIIDDFGTGYSSLGALKNYPVDITKIDRSFCAGMIESEADAAIVESVIRIGDVMDFGVVAEGIETAEQLETVASSGCQIVQGWLFAPAMSGADVRDHLDEWARGYSFAELEALSPTQSTSW